MKKTLGVILSVIFSVIYFGILINLAGLKVVLISVGLTTLIAVAGFLCLYLLSDD